MTLTHLERMALRWLDDDDTSMQSMPCGLWPHALSLLRRGYLEKSNRPMRDVELTPIARAALGEGDGQP